MSTALVNATVPLLRVGRPLLVENDRYEPRIDDLSWLDNRAIKLDWIERSLEQQNCALFEASLMGVRDALRAEISRRTGQELWEICENLTVDHCIVTAFEMLVGNPGLDFAIAMNRSIDLVSPEVAA